MEEEFRFTAIKGVINLLLIYFVCIGIILLLFGCTTTKYIPVVEHHTEYITKIDSVFLKDSIRINDSIQVFIKGDTVIKERWHTTYIDKWKEIARIDTIIRNDTISVPYPVEKKLGYWEKAKYRVEGTVTGVVITIILSAAIAIVWWIRKKKKVQ